MELEYEEDECQPIDCTGILAEDEYEDVDLSSSLGLYNME